MKVLLDTNILVSTIFFPNNSTHALIREVSTYHELYLCDYVIQELREVTSRKFPHKIDDMELSFYELDFHLIEHVETPLLHWHMRDSHDEPILAAALEAGIDVIATGDKDFYALTIARPRIVGMGQFLDEYGR